jgi:DnaK suppressor protein
MLKAAELREFKDRLVVLQARVRGDVEQLTGEALESAEAGGDSKSPTHIAELGTQNYEQDFALRVVENDQEMLEEIRAALKRIDDGVFGACESCLAEGKPPSKAMIPKTRLRAIPYTRNCVSCERKREELSL